MIFINLINIVNLVSLLANQEKLQNYVVGWTHSPHATQSVASSDGTDPFFLTHH